MTCVHGFALALHAPPNQLHRSSQTIEVQVPDNDVFAVYGAVSGELAEVPNSAVQFSPLMPGSSDLANVPPASLSGCVMLAPPGTAERAFALAQALRALRPGAELTVLAPKDRGGARLAGELRDFGCEPEETARRHHRICRCGRPEVIAGLDAALLGGSLQQLGAALWWTQPGVFSWNRPDPGSALLAQHLPDLSGQGADFGCGTGFLTAKVLVSPKITGLQAIDNDRRAIAAGQRNISDDRIKWHWADVRALGPQPSGLDFIVMNPPFHDAGHEDQSLGQEFVRQAAARLRKGGTLWLVANRHLAYEAILKTLFKRVNSKAGAAGFKIVEAVK